MSVPKNRPPAQGQAGTVACRGLLLGQAGRFFRTLEGFGRWLLPPTTPHPGLSLFYFILDPNKNGNATSRWRLPGVLCTPGQLQTTTPPHTHTGSSLSLRDDTGDVLFEEPASLAPWLLSEPHHPDTPIGLPREPASQYPAELLVPAPCSSPRCSR